MNGRPLIVIVDDRPRGLSALLDAMARRYGGDYQTVGHLSAHAALEDLARASQHGQQVALVIADQWMPEMTGGELLQRAHALHPEAQRALLVGWGDTRANEVILQACALGQLDNYILKPWAPPEVHLYPVVGEFLADWARTHGPQLELLRVVSDDPSPRGQELRDLFERYGIPHGCYPADSPAGQKLIAEVGIDRGRLPAIVLLDGKVLHTPTNLELADLLWVSATTAGECDLAIIGAGPSGLAAAVCGASEGLRTVVIEREVVGGQASTSSLIRNFLGFPRGISGAELARRAYQQAWLFGAKYVLARHAIGLHTDEARGAAPDGARLIITLDDGHTLAARAVVIATGAEYRRLGVPRIDRFNGVGVLYSAGADVALALKGKDVIVCGGGNSAGQAVVHLARSVRRVIHVVRGRALSDTMSTYLIDEIARLPNVEQRFATDVVDAEGARGLERVTLRDQRTGARETVVTPALFVMIGALPHTDWLAGVIERDGHGFLVTGAELPEAARARFAGRAPLPFETSLPGVFAAGDVRHGSIKRLASAVGEGTAAVRLVHEYFQQMRGARPGEDDEGPRPVERGERREERHDEPMRAPADLQ